MSFLLTGNAWAISYSSAGTYSYTVPAGVTTLYISMSGGGGGGGGNDGTAGEPGGAGQYGSATVPVTPGQILTVYVGGAGGAGAGCTTGAAGGAGGASAWTYGGVAGTGGTGGRSGTAGCSGSGGGGGGASAIVLGTDVIMVTGGGAGGTGANISNAPTKPINGGDQTYATSNVQGGAGKDMNAVNTGGYTDGGGGGGGGGGWLGGLGGDPLPDGVTVTSATKLANGGSGYLNSAYVPTGSLFIGGGSAGGAGSTAGTAGSVTINTTATVSQIISGHVFNDKVGDGLNDGVIGDSNNPTNLFFSTSVRLWRDANADGVLNSGDTLVSTVSTDQNGLYTFTGVSSGTRYFVAVDAPSHLYVLGSSLAEQTYATSNGLALSSADAMRAFCDQDGQATTTNTLRSSSGACYGGRNGATVDSPGTVSSEHVTAVTTGTADVTGVDFGFSYNVVTTTSTTGQGSLAQFIINANNESGSNAMRFVPAVCRNDINATPNATTCAGSTDTYWMIRSATLQALTDAGTTIDGRAYSATDGVTLGNSNSVVLGTGGTVGTGAVALSQLGGPELQLYASALTVSSSNTTIQYVAMTNSGTSITQTTGNNLLIQYNLLGSASAKVYGSPSGGGISLKNNGSTDTATVRYNLFTASTSYYSITTAARTSGVTIQGNEFAGGSYLGQVSLASYGLVNSTISGNLFNNSNYTGYYDTSTGGNAGSGNTLQNNTFASSGAGYDEVYLNSASTGYQIRNNIFTNAGSGSNTSSAGVSLANTANTQGVKISQNSFYGNGANGIDLGDNGVTTNTNACSNANGTGTATSNGSLARPVITSAVLSGSNVTVTGTLCATGQYTIELYAALAGTGDGSGLTAAGEGKTYLAAQTGITTGAFSITVPVSQITTGRVTAIAIRETATGGTINDTSEFAQNMVVGVPISGTVFEDVTGDGVAGGETTTTGAQRPLVGVTVRLWEDTNGNGTLDTGDLQVATTTTDASGNYSFAYAGTLFVTVDAPKKNGGVTTSGLIGEQTHAGASGTTVSPLCDRDGEATWTDNLITTGSGGVACYGGRNASLADCTIATVVSTATGTALPATCTVATAAGQTPMEHVTKLSVSTTPVTGIDFGFSFSVVTHTGTTGQGSVTQFATNANAVTASSGQGAGAANLMRFVPASCKNDMGGTCLGTSTYWKVTSATIPALTDPYTTLDGTAYSYLDGTTVVNPNNVTLGSGGTVGTDAVTLGQLNAPELELYASPITVSAANTTIQNLALDGSGTAISQTTGNGLLVQNNLIGSTNAKTYSGAVGGGISLKNNGSTDTATIRNNLFYTQANYASITTAGKSSGVTIQGNQFSGGSYLGHIYLPTYGLVGASITGNLFNNSNYYDYYESSTSTNAGSGVTVQNNTFASSAPGYDLVNLNTTSAGYVFTRNILTNAGGGANTNSAGIALANNANPQGVKISQNSFYGNGGNAIDLGDNGSTANTNACSNANGTGAATANGSLARPVLTSASLASGGTSLTVSGTVCGTGQYTIELYKVASGTASGDGSPQAGEGAVYLGSFTGQTGGVFSGTLSGLSGTAVLAATDSVTAIAIRETATGGTLGDTSEFSANISLVALSGTVFEDITGNLLTGGEATTTGDQRPIAGVTVRLFNSAGTQLATTTTDSSGIYNFQNALPASPAGTYYVSVDAPTRDGGSTVSGILGEQTYGSAGTGNTGTAGGTTGYGTLCAGLGGSSYTDQGATTTTNTAANPTGGACYGGRRGATADAGGTTLNSNEHVTRVVLGTASVTGIDFGFSFNVVTNVSNSGQGSLRQFLTNANAITGANTMRFVPAVAANAGGATFWSTTAATALPTLTDTYTTIDGTAYLFTDGTTITNPNTAVLGHVGSVGTGADGRVGTGDEPTLGGVPGPEFQIVRGGAAGSVLNGLTVSASNTTVQNIAIYGFGSASSNGDVVVSTAGTVSSLLIQNNVIGAAASSFTDPGAGNRTGGSNLYLSGGTVNLVDIRNNAIGFSGTGEGLFSNAAVTNLTLDGNTFKNGAITGANALSAGVEFLGSGVSGTSVVQRNYITGYPEQGLQFNSSTGVQVINNSLINNGQRAATGETMGVLFYGSANAGGMSFTQNIVQGTGTGAGLTVDNNTGGVLISRNSFSNNAGNAIDLGVYSGTSNWVTTGTGCTSGVTANGGLGRPLLSRAILFGGAPILSGSYCATGTYSLEFYKASTGSNAGDVGSDTLQAGEGTDYMGVLTGLSGGMLSGATLSAPNGALAVGDKLTAINQRTTVGASGGLVGDTSEFSANVTVQSGARITVRKFVDGNPVRLSANDQFTIGAAGAAAAFLDGAAPASQSTSCSGTATTSCGGSSTPAATISGFYVVAGQSVTLTDMMKAGSTSLLSVYRTDLTCSATKAGGASGSVTTTMGASGTGTTLSGTPVTTTVTPTGSGSAMNSAWTLIPGADDDIVCDWHNVTNAPQLTIRKQISSGATGVAFTFTGTATHANGFPTTVTAGQTLTPVALNTPVAGTKVVLSAPSTLTEVQENLPSGWVLSGVTCVDANAAVDGNPAGVITGTILNGNTLQLPASYTPAGADLQCTFTNTYTGFGITGRVILDTGAGGGTAHDGVHNGTERGQAGVAVSLTNCGSTVYGSTTTDTSGSFVLSTTGAPAGAVCVVRALPAGYQAVSGNAGTTGGSYAQATDRIGFTLATGTSYSGLVFGGVPQSTFTTDGFRQVAAGQSAIYSHVYTAGSSATVSFATSEAPTQSGQNWVSVLYVDSDCNGELGAGDTLITGPMSVMAGQSVCILTRVNSPAGAAEGSRDVTTVTLSETLSPTPQGGAMSRVMTHTDTTTVAPTGLTLNKQVRKVSACPATAAASLADGTIYTTSNNARPGDYLEYLLSYRNDAGMPVTAVHVVDSTPAYTRFKRALCLSTPAVGLSGCAVTTQPAADGTGSVQWTITDAATAPVGVQPGETGTVSYCVQVQP